MAATMSFRSAERHRVSMRSPVLDTWLDTLLYTTTPDRHVNDRHVPLLSDLKVSTIAGRMDLSTSLAKAAAVAAA